VFFFCQIAGEFRDSLNALSFVSPFFSFFLSGIELYAWNLGGKDCKITSNQDNVRLRFFF